MTSCTARKRFLRQGMGSVYFFAVACFRGLNFFSDPQLKHLINDGAHALTSAFAQNLRNACSVKTKSSCSLCATLSQNMCFQQRRRVEKLPNASCFSVCLMSTSVAGFFFTLRVSFAVSDETWYVNLGKFRMRKTSRRATMVSVHQSCTSVLAMASCFAHCPFRTGFSL